MKGWHHHCSCQWHLSNGENRPETRTILAWTGFESLPLWLQCSFLPVELSDQPGREKLMCNIWESHNFLNEPAELSTRLTWLSHTLYIKSGYCKLVTVTDVRAERQPSRAKVLANVNTQPEWVWRFL